MKVNACIAVTAGALLFAASSAGAAETLNYIGSFRANTGHYAEALAFVPGGTATADRGQEVAGPTVVTIGQHSGTDYLKEWDIPTLVTSGSPNSATEVTPASGGTFVDNVNTLSAIGGAESVVVMGGELWLMRTDDTSDDDWGVGRVKFGSDEDWSVDTNISYRQEYGEPAGATYTSAGMATKWDEADTFVATRWDYETKVDGVDEGYRVVVNKHTKGTPTGGNPDIYNWSSSNVFEIYIQDPDNNNADAGNAGLRHVNIEYVEVNGTKYYVLAVQNAENSLVLDFYDAASATGVVSAPDFSIDVSDDITNGVGWWNTTSFAKDLAWDGVDTLYVLNSEGGGGSAASYIHAFQFDTAPVPEPATLALLAVGGLAVVAGRRRRG